MVGDAVEEAEEEAAVTVVTTTGTVDGTTIAGKVLDLTLPSGHSFFRPRSAGPGFIVGALFRMRAIHISV